MKDTIKQVKLASRATQTLSFSCVIVQRPMRFRALSSKVAYSFQNDFLWKQDNLVIILVQFILFTPVCIALEAGEVEVTLSHYSALLLYVFPVRCRHLVHFDIPPIRYRLITFTFLIRLSPNEVHQMPRSVRIFFIEPLLRYLQPFRRYKHLRSSTRVARATPLSSSINNFFIYYPINVIPVPSDS